MKGTILEKIIEAKRGRVETAKRQTDLVTLKERARSARSNAKPHRLRNALSNDLRLNIIAEIKRASPSKGVINADIDIAQTALNYAVGGACAISVLTDEDFFKGSLDDLITVRKSVDVPILRKDFIVDEFQIFEAAEAGADAVLLIVTALTKEQLRGFRTLAEDDLGLDTLVEVHTDEELKIATEMGARLIGVNNRDLKTFDVSLDVSRQLVKNKPSGSLMVAESGIVSREEVIDLRSLGFDGFRVGETLMRSGDPKEVLEAWV